MGESMPLFPWRFNRNMNTNMPCGYMNGYGNFQCNGWNPNYNQNYNMNNIYNGQENFNSNYSDSFQQMIKRNIDAEKEMKIKKDSIKQKEELSEKIGNFIKNERNSFLFYEYLRGICSNEKCRKVLKKISDNCTFVWNYYSEFYKETFEKNFTLSKSDINENVSFYDGILWALEEESNSVLSISKLIDEFSECDKIKIALSCKNARIGYLCYILNVYKGV